MHRPWKLVLCWHVNPSAQPAASCKKVSAPWHLFFTCATFVDLPAVHTLVSCVQMLLLCMISMS